MKIYNPDPAAQKVKYIVSIAYLLLLAFIVGGSYLHQQQNDADNTPTSAVELSR